MNDIPEFTDVVPEHCVLDGDKVPIDKIINLPLVFLNWLIDKSKFPDKGNETQWLTLQFILSGENRITFTGSTVLLEQVQKYEECRDKTKPRAFRAVIRKIGKCYKFCRTENKEVNHGDAE